MAHFKFVGDENGEGPDLMMAFGCVFRKGESVAVLDKAVIAKLEGNSHFQKVDGRTVKKKTKNGDES